MGGVAPDRGTVGVRTALARGLRRRPAYAGAGRVAHESRTQGTVDRLAHLVAAPSRCPAADPHPYRARPGLRPRGRGALAGFVSADLGAGEDARPRLSLRRLHVLVRFLAR